MKVFSFLKKVWKGEFEYPESLERYYENSPFWSTLSRYMCGTGNPISNFLYLLWGDTGCPCCSFFRGILVGMFLMGVIVCLI